MTGCMFHVVQFLSTRKIQQTNYLFRNKKNPLSAGKKKKRKVCDDFGDFESILTLFRIETAQNGRLQKIVSIVTRQSRLRP